MKDGNPVSVRMFLEYRFDLSNPIVHGERLARLYYDRDCRDYSNIPPFNMIFFKNENEAKKALHTLTERNSALCAFGQALRVGQSIKGFQNLYVTIQQNARAGIV